MKDWHPADLSAQVIDALLERTGVDPDAVEDVIWGCVQQVAEQAGNVGRNAVLSSRLPEHVPATSVNRACGSSQQTLHFAAQAVMSGTMDIVIAGGVEAMTRVPMGTSSELPAQHGFGGPGSVTMAERYPGIVFSQFTGAEMMAVKYDLAKDVMDRFSFESHCRARAATEAGAFAAEIVPIAVGEASHTVDEGIRFDASLEGIAGVRLLREGGRITAASASQICDGASGVMVVNDAGLKRLGVRPLARVHHMSVWGGDPVIMLEAPIPATQRALSRAGMSIEDIDLYEVNEAFASVPVAWLEVLGADPGRLNVNGGAISLGHPLGGSGTKLMTTLVNALRARGKRYGLQTMCEGGGMANVTISNPLIKRGLGTSPQLGCREQSPLAFLSFGGM
ncbi:MAG: acetyl-CoA C-acetyltransferase [Rhodospirillales bacterium]